MKLSIIVPVYNMVADGKLAFCLDSLLNQTIDDYEIIAVNDASTDNSLDVLREYEKKSDRVKVIALTENHRQGGAKNAALDVCVGDFIGFIDSDDWIAPDMYERLLNATEKEQADMAACDLSIVYEHTYTHGERIPSMDDDMNGDLTKERLKKLILQSGALVNRVYKRDLFMNPKLRFPDKMFYEDNAIGVELLFRAKRIAYINEPMYYYYQHGNSTVHTVSESKCEDRMEAMRIMHKLALEGGYYDEYKNELEYRFITLFYQNTLFSYMQGKQHKRLSFIKKMGKEMAATFPDFEKNSLYLERINAEERKLMHMQQRSTLLFFLYYKLLWFYRKLRYGK